LLAAAVARVPMADKVAWLERLEDAWWAGTASRIGAMMADSRL